LSTSTYSRVTAIFTLSLHDALPISKYKTPSNGIVFLGLLAFVAPFLGRPALVWIVNAGGIGIVIGYLFVSIAFIKLRKVEPDLDRPYKIKEWKVVGALASILSIIFISFYLPELTSALIWLVEWMIVLVVDGVGIALYMLRSKQTVPHPDEASYKQPSSMK